jgi:glycogen operon protein
LIAEPWDIGEGGYQVGEFPPLWTEWNGKYRDTVRNFWRGAETGVAELASRLSGSSDLYQDDGRRPFASINFVTCHDGFPLRDLVSYDTKHNETNGEENRDGDDDNRSWNCGVEGETTDPDTRALRRRQAANLVTTLLLSTGVPMVRAGDELFQTQRGNNNAYCQDNDVSWLDWSMPDGTGMLELVRDLIALRRRHPVFRQHAFLQGRPVTAAGAKDLAWFGPHGEEMAGQESWHAEVRSLGMYLSGQGIRTRGPRGEIVTDESFLLVLHSGREPCEFTLPGQPWASAYTVELRTDNESGTALEAGEPIRLSPHSAALLRVVAAAD